MLLLSRLLLVLLVLCTELPSLWLLFRGNHVLFLRFFGAVLFFLMVVEPQRPRPAALFVADGQDRARFLDGAPHVALLINILAGEWHLVLLLLLKADANLFFPALHDLCDLASRLVFKICQILGVLLYNF